MGEEDGEKPLRKIAKAFEELAEQSEIAVAPFSNACALVSPLFGCLGIAFKFAERDYVAKVKDLSEASSSILTLQAVLDQDILAKTVQKPGSHTRNLLRVKRGLDMVKVLFEQIIVTEGDSLKEAASTAYSKVFAPYHGWAIRKAVAAGMYALPTKPQLLRKLNEDENSAKIYMQSYVTSVDAVVAHVDKLFLSKDLGIDW
ncbi:hypothetical protein RND81_06G144100 [Saponaria officinalis]|uniref:Glycolipid transfer protein domain-containing protein n=1 Tax=Saponaria officinalis TaxID=3572 RepID=A0AAW1KBU0_SAPOF